MRIQTQADGNFKFNDQHMNIDEKDFFFIPITIFLFKNMYYANDMKVKIIVAKCKVAFLITLKKVKQIFSSKIKNIL